MVSKPFFPMLKEAPPRKGFFERDQFEAVRRQLPAALQPIATFEYLTGWRNCSEVYRLTWAHVSFAEAMVRLDPGMAKNDEPRQFPLTAELRALLEGQRAATEALQRRTGRIIPWVFHRHGPAGEGHAARVEGGVRRRQGCPGRYQHDFRRTAVRNLVRAGIPERVAMQLTGHKTRGGVRALQHRERGRPPRGGREARPSERTDAGTPPGSLAESRSMAGGQSGRPHGHNFGHSRALSAVSLGGQGRRAKCARLRWCRRGDSNPHTLAGTRP